MAEKSSFFNSVNGDRRYLAGDFADFFSPLITNGFFPNQTNLQAVADNGNMNVVVKAGRAWINGYQYINTSDLILAHDVADGVLNRVDRIVVQLSFVDREIKTIIKKGTPASNPSPPQLQRDADVYELGIATVTINAGVTSIAQVNVTDTRNDVTVGGIVNNLFAEANAQASNVTIDDIANYFVSSTVEGALIELAQPTSIYKSGKDANGIYTVLEKKNTAGVRTVRSVLSNADTDGNYLTRTITRYKADGTTTMITIVMTVSYDTDGEFQNEVISSVTIAAGV